MYRVQEDVYRGIVFYRGLVEYYLLVGGEKNSKSGLDKWNPERVNFTFEVLLFANQTSDEIVVSELVTTYQLWVYELKKQSSSYIETLLSLLDYSIKIIFCLYYLCLL